MTIHVHNQEERDGALKTISKLCLLHVGEFRLDAGVEKMREAIEAELKEAILSYDRRQLTDCHYEPMCGWAHVRFDVDGNFVSMEAVRRDVEPSEADEVLAQYCLVWPNTFDTPVTPYAGTWDGTVQDFHRDEPYEWELYRGWNVFGHGSAHYADYRFLKTSLKVLLPDTDGSEHLPDWFHIATKDDDVIRRYVRAWAEEGYGELYGDAMENIPVRIVIAKRPGLKPFTGAWDDAPWEEA